MIQRIQTVFLFASLCFLLSMFFIPVAELVGSQGGIFVYKLTGFYQVEMGEMHRVDREYSLMAFGILITALNFINIFMYKRRVLQMRLCVYNILLLVGFLGVMFYVLHNVQQVSSVSYRLPFIFPVVAIILHYLAFRGIRKDELMVQALSRLR